jgi:hypothetical protein
LGQSSSQGTALEIAAAIAFLHRGLDYRPTIRPMGRFWDDGHAK